MLEESRTYGIEIECISSMDQRSLAARIGQYFADFGIFHTAVPAGYQHNADGQNRSRWEVQTDASLRPTPQYPYKIEVVSPVLSGEEGLRALWVVCHAMDGVAKVNKSCGLHVHHGIEGDDIVRITDQYLAIEDWLYRCFPPSRKYDTRYARPMGQIARATGVGSINTRDQLRQWFGRRVRTRYCGFNLESYWLRGTIEFRGHSGTTEYEKIANWVRITQRFIRLTLTGADFRSCGSFAAFTEKLKGSTEGIQAEGTNFNPRPGSKTYQVFHLYLEASQRVNPWLRISEAAREILPQSNSWDAATGRVKRALSEARRGGWVVEYRGRGVHREAKISAPVSMAAVEISEADSLAVDWLEGRYHHFLDAHSNREGRRQAA